MRNLAQVPSGTQVFIDTNILVLYYLDQEPLKQVCLEFLERIQSKEIQGFTSAIAVAELTHRMMIIEARTHLSLPASQIVQYLESHPLIIQQLTRHLSVASDISRMNINILPVTYKELHASKSARSKFGLLTNDSLIVAVMRAHKLRHLATQDAAFDRVEGIQVWSPSLAD